METTLFGPIRRNGREISVIEEEGTTTEKSYPCILTEMISCWESTPIKYFLVIKTGNKEERIPVGRGYIKATFLRQVAVAFMHPIDENSIRKRNKYLEVKDVNFNVNEGGIVLNVRRIYERRRRFFPDTNRSREKTIVVRR